LEFLGLKREAAYYEKGIEFALILHLQEFLLKIGRGFSFVARQNASCLKMASFLLF
jgi:predicted nuclease of restriction endonuclease-like (RecB) superfamily